MFRRKEEGLFDSQTDAHMSETDATHEIESGAVDSSPAAMASPSSNFGASSASANPSLSSPASQSSSMARPASAASPSVTSSSSSAAASSFRPVQPASSPRTNEQGKSIPAPIALDRAKAGKRVLTVGNDILLKGEIATCDRLVIEGQVDASLNEVHTVEISECGSFKGSAQIEDAEIRGLFEGDLTVRGRLVIYSTGKVRGKITYGEIEIERGGELSGEIKMVPVANHGRHSHTQVGKAPNLAVKDDKVAA